MGKEQESNTPEKQLQNIGDQERQGQNDKAENLIDTLLAVLEGRNRQNIHSAVRSDSEIKNKIAEALVKKEPVAVAFPPCSDVLLGLINEMPENSVSDTNGLTINHIFAEYFTFANSSIGGHQELPGGQTDRTRLELLLRNNPCLTGEWPPQYCMPSPCIRLEGNRRIWTDLSGNRLKIRRLFIADLAWAFFVGDLMGTFQMIGKILDEYAYQGAIPMSNGSIHADIKDDMVALVLEAMTRQTESGNSSKVRDRDTSYRRAFSWTTEAGRKLGLKATFNAAFNMHFHKLIYLALQFYNAKRLGIAIRATAENTGITSTATLVTIRDTISLLKKSFENFNYGRNYHNTLSAIVWTIAGLKLIEELRFTFGIPPEYNTPDAYIPAAYDILVLNRPITTGESNRFETHLECAKNIRSILLDLEVLNFSEASIGGDLEAWLNAAESNIEGYRTAYRTLTGVDLEATQSPAISQQA